MENLVKLLPVIAVVALVVIIFLLGYVKAPPDVAYIISGIRKRPRVLIGRAGIRIPFLERVDKLIVRQISIDIKSEGYIPTNDFIGVDVDAVAKVRVKTDPEGTHSPALCHAGAIHRPAQRPTHLLGERGHIRLLYEPQNPRGLYALSAAQQFDLRH